MDRLILWVARIWGTAILAFVVYFLLAGIFGRPTDDGFASAREIVIFLMFPVGTILGLIVALRWDGPGGLLATLSIVGLFALRPDLASEVWFSLAIAPPGILYLTHWFLKGSAADNASP